MLNAFSIPSAEFNHLMIELTQLKDLRAFFQNTQQNEHRTSRSLDLVFDINELFYSSFVPDE